MSRTNSEVSGSKPLSGIRIADLTQAWAGSFATQILADAGAEVIKVEARKRPDPWRGGFEGERGLPTYPGDEPGKKPYNRSYLANSVNRNKVGITLDLASDRGRELFLDLVRSSDLVMENFTPRVLENLGIGFDTLRGARENIVLVSMPAYGLSGPYRDFPGIGGTIEPMSGNSFLLSMPGEGPRVSGVMYPDPVAGITGASAAVLGLLAYGLRGKAVHLEVSQHEAMIAMLGEFFAQGASNYQDAVGNGDTHHVPSGAFQTADGEWLVLSIRTDDQWTALCDLPWFSALRPYRAYTATERRLHRNDLEAATREAIAQLSIDEAEAALKPLLPSCTRVVGMEEVLHNEALRHAGFFTSLFQPGVGTHEVTGPLVRFGTKPWKVDRATPGHGQDSRHVLTQMLNVSEEEYQRLVELGVTGEGPPGD